MSEYEFWHLANICTWGFGPPSPKDGLHSPVPHLHPSNSPSCSSISAMSGSHTYRKEGDKTWVLSFTQSTASFLSCAETFLLISQPLPHQQVFGCESTGFFHATPIHPHRGSGPLEHSKDAPTTALSPLWNKLTRALHASLLICQKCINLLLQHPPGQECCSLGSLPSHTRSGPVL